MKKHWVHIAAAAFIVLLCTGCDSPTQPAVDSCDCIENPDIEFAYVPPNRYYGIKRSVDGTTFAYLHTRELKKLYLYSAATGKQTVIDFDLPPYYSIYRIVDFQWCPYDPSKLLLNTVTEVDFGDRNPAYTSNAYIVDKSGTWLATVTPPLYPWFGAPPNSLYISSWLPGSSPAADSLLVEGVGIYVPQKEQFIPQYWKYSFLDRYASNHLQVGLDTNAKQVVIGGILYDLPSIPAQWDGSATFSPDGTKILFDGSIPYQQPCARVLYVADISNALASTNATLPVAELSPHTLFCMNHYDVGSAFVTDSTIAVSMYRDGDLNANYYEMSLSGKLLRRISNP